MNIEEMNALLHKLLQENKEMKEVLECANRDLSNLFHSLRKGDKIDVKEIVCRIGTSIENFLNERNYLI